MTTVVKIVSWYGLRIDASHKNQPNEGKLLLYKLLLSLDIIGYVCIISYMCIAYNIYGLTVQPF